MGRVRTSNRFYLRGPNTMVENLGLIIGIGCIMLSPMVFGGYCTIKAVEYTDKVTKQVWEEWEDDEVYKTQKPTSSINYNQ